jgi:hypothetical protein
MMSAATAATAAETKATMETEAKVVEADAKLDTAHYEVFFP